MSTPEASQPERFEQRVTQIEQSMAFLQRAVDDLDKVLVGVQRRLDTLEGDLVYLAQRIAVGGRNADEPRSIEDDRPPHY